LLKQKELYAAVLAGVAPADPVKEELAEPETATGPVKKKKAKG
jgi:hypothetical protein